MLNLKDIKKDYITSSETVNALRGISVSFRRNEFVSILGPSGCGKTTLLNIIGGLDAYTSGDLVINGVSTKNYRDRDWDVYRNHRIGFIFQSYNLIPHQTVLGNVELALTIAGLDKAERIRRAKLALDRVGLEGQYYKRPNQLSGGQCQRVAIARALVNDPEILLADEPTGALDTVTSVQIMDLIKEISKERLVIMVTHNPELAEQYSSRIIRLLDGLVIQDSNPFSEADELAECELIAKEEALAEEAELHEIGDEKKYAKIKKKRREKAKMSFFTAFMLSAKNLLSKKGRTAMVSVAGSIGIIGIAMVLAFSAGIKGYISSMQDDMLSGNPIQITETTFDLNALTGMMNTSDKVEIIKEPNKAYINSIIEYIAKASNTINATIVKNDITQQYIDYIKAMPKEYYNAMLFEYGIDMSNNIYTSLEIGGGEQILSISALTEIYMAMLKGTDFEEYTTYISQIAPSFEQAPNNTAYIAEQYDVYGEIADEKDEIMLVLNGEQEITDILLARLGYYTEAQYLNIVYKATEDERYNPALDVSYIDYDTLLSEDKVFKWYPNDSVFTKYEAPIPQMAAMRPFIYHNNANDITKTDGALDLRITGVLVTNETTTYGCLQSGIYYTEALTDYVFEKNAESEIAKYIEENGTITSMPYATPFPGVDKVGIWYEYEYRPFVLNTETEPVKAYAFVGSPYGAEDIIGSMGQGNGGGAEGSGGSSAPGGAGGAGNSGAGFDMASLQSIKTLSARSVGANTLANAVSIYPISFESKDLVTDYLDVWNADGAVNLNGEQIAVENRTDITYTDTLELVINMINSMIDVVSAALIAFTSISLVVSTVMIGIITYVSVVERIKEIGVIRALGGRKKDVSRLFTAETFIIGLTSGLFGVAVTYGISAIASAIIYSLFGIPNIAFLPVSNALTLIAISIGLTLISGVMPARSAAKKDPVVALRTE